MANPKIVFTGVDQVSAVTQKVSASVAKLGTALGAIAGGVVVNEFFKVVNALDAIEESAQSAGIAVDSLTALRYAANQAGVGSEELDAALTKLNVKLDAAASGSKDAKEVFDRLGITVKSSSGNILSADDALGKIADKFASFRDGPEKAALAVDIFGKSGAKLIPLLNQGAKGIDNLKTEAEKLGVVIGGDVVTAAAKFADEIDRLKASVDAIKIDLASGLIPILQQLVDEWNAAKSATGSTAGALGMTFTNFLVSADEANQKVIELNREIQKYQKTVNKGDNQFAVENAKLRIAALEREKKFYDLVYQARKRAEGDGGFESNFPMGGNAPPKKGNAKQQLTDGQQLIRQLQDEIAKTEDLTRVQELQRAVAEGRVKFDSKAQQQMALDIAASIDDEKKFTAAVKDSEEATKRANVEQQNMNKSRQARFDELIGTTGVKRLAQDMEMLDEAFFAGTITVAQYDAGLTKAFGLNSEAAKGIKESTDYAEKFAMTMTSSLGEIITSGGSASDIFRALLQDILKLITQMLILEPIAESLKSMFKGFGKGGGGGTGAGSFLDDLLWSFMGGMASGGTLRPGQWAVVGERGPELAFGGTAGQTIIPGGAGGVTVVQNIKIDSRSDINSIRQAMEATRRQTEASIMDSMNRRGAFARL